MLIAVGVLAVALGLGVVACLAAAADRSARAEAWRRIAAERRWNHENIPTPPRAPSTRDDRDRSA